MSAPPNNPTHSVLLPPAICLSIIRHCLADPVTLPLPALDIRLLLMLVSQEWRKIVLSPEFWDRIAFLPGPFNNPKHQLEILESLVEHSGPNTLSFQFLPQLKKDPGSLVGLPNQDLFYGAGRINLVEKIILPYAPRLRYLKLVLPHTQLILTLCKIPEGALEALESVDISCSMSYINPFALVDAGRRYIFHRRPFKSSPRLHKLSLSTVRGINPLDLWVPWPQMTMIDLRTTALPPDIFYGIMQQTCCSLVDGFFSVEFDLYSCYLEHLYGPKVEMVSLKILRVRFLNLSYHPTFPLLFTLPLIQELWVERADRIATFDWSMHLYTTWLSSGSLQKLVLMNFPFRPPAIAHHERNTRRRTSYSELEDLFKAIPNLKGLGLPIGVHVHSETLVKIAEGTLLPNCHTLEFATDVDPTIVLTMVAMRNIPPPPPDILRASRLTAVTLTFPSTFHNKSQQLDQVMRSLNISRGYLLRFLPPCNGCRGHCCFGL